MPSFDYTILETLGSFSYCGSNVTSVFLLWHTVKQMEYTVKLSKIQTEHRFRPWVGPEGNIKHLNPTKEVDSADSFQEN